MYQKLLKVFVRLVGANLTINLKKGVFCRSSHKFLSFEVGRQGFLTDPHKVPVIRDYPHLEYTT